MLLDERFAGALQPGDHGTTFGGSPVPCAAALAHLQLRDDLRLDDHVRESGAALAAGLREIAVAFPDVVAPPRGMGLMLGLPVLAPNSATAIAYAARDGQHLLITTAGDNTLRFVPPLVVTAEDITEGLGRLRAAIRDTPGPTSR
jgi:acetylornithine/succinyldiaminopimelate/putrescine aminotransferase